MFKLLPNVKFIDSTELKAIGVNNSNLTYMFGLVSDGVKNIVGKGENAGQQHFLFYLQCFQKFFLSSQGS